MQINAVQFVNEAGDKVLVVTDRGFLTEPWPSSSALGDQVQAWLDAGNTITPVPAPDLSQLRSDKLQAINEAYEQEMEVILSQYPWAETLSFDKQEREAREWQTNNTASTPYLEAMRTERPLDKQELVNRIIAKADQFSVAHGAATGKRQRLEDEIANADSDTLKTINW